MKPVDIIVPIYRDTARTLRCLNSVLPLIAHYSNFYLVMINDASPDSNMKTALETFARQHTRITLLENPENLGFVATVNRGMAHNIRHDVVLLNSDTEVSGDWLVRLQQAVYSANNIGTATPFANNATICSFPNFCEDNALPDGFNLSELDQLFANTIATSSTIDLPTAVGCCMYIRRDCLNAVGFFDAETFGRGYGEENDFCQRAIKLGWRHILATNVFIYHAGGISFGDEQQALQQRALSILKKRYPHYEIDVQKFIIEDPPATIRNAVLVNLITQKHKPIILFVSHGMGGGVKQHVQELASLISEKAHAILLSAFDRKNIHLFLDASGKINDGLSFNLEQDYKKLIYFLKTLTINYIHFHHLMNLPEPCWQLPQDLNVPYEITIHDYYLINGNPTLTDPKGSYCENPLNIKNLYNPNYPIPYKLNRQAWHHKVEIFLENATRIIFPSEGSAKVFKQFFPLSNIVAWHPDSENVFYPAVHIKPLHSDENLKVLVIGALSKEKGSELLSKCAKECHVRKIPVEFHLLGYANKRLHHSVIVHGSYKQTDVVDLIKEINPHIVWWPARLPETYSYTLSSVLILGLPIVVPDLGAFPERTSERTATWVIPWHLSISEYIDFWQKQINALKQGTWHTQRSNKYISYEKRWFNFYNEHYLQDKINLLPCQSLNWSLAEFKQLFQERNIRRRTSIKAWRLFILITLVKIRRAPLVRQVANYIPQKFQHKISCWLSNR